MAFESSPLNRDELMADVYRDDIEAAFTKIDQAAVGHTPNVVVTIPPADMDQSQRLVVAASDNEADKPLNALLVRLADNAAAKSRLFIANDIAPSFLANFEIGPSESEALDASIRTVSEAVTTVSISVASLGEARDPWTLTTVSRTHPQFTSRSVVIAGPADTPGGSDLKFELSEIRFGDEEPITRFEKTDKTIGQADGAVHDSVSAADIQYATFMANQIQYA